MAALRKYLASLPISQLREEIKAAATQLESLFTATAHWRQLYRAQQDAQQLRQKMEDHQLGLNGQETQLQETATALQAVSAQRSAAAAMLEKAMVAEIGRAHV